MRFKSRKRGGFQVFAVTGNNTVSFGIDFDDGAAEGLLGFAVERYDPEEEERYFIRGMKVFRSVIPMPDERTEPTTYDHPIQSFVWDDFSAKPGRKYTYTFYPLRGRPKNIDRSAQPIEIDVETEPQFVREKHDIFFNRGVASSQAYARKYQNKRPDQLTGAKRKEAEEWLSRGLDEGLIGFIDDAKAGDELQCCFYEFRYLPVLKRLKAALDRDVDVKIIIDGKDNTRIDDNGVESNFPREENLKALREAGIPRRGVVTLRDARKSSIQHNKFMVLLKGTSRRPTEVWTGSTNLSIGGIHGQTNVGHRIRDAALASKFSEYWQLLQSNPGGREGDDASEVRAKNRRFRADVDALNTLPASLAEVETGITPIFSPQSALAALDLYTNLFEEAESLACVTLAFNIDKRFKALLEDNTTGDNVSFFLLERRDRPNARSAQPYVRINSRQNVYSAWGSYLREPLYQWAQETSAGALGLNQHVSFIHSKFMLIDPLGEDPIVITGSANFSEASTNDNDENMLIIRGDRRVADIYFTEFNRLFFHYYFRSVQEATLGRENERQPGEGLFLAESDSWVAKYRPKTLRRKRLDILASLAGT